MKEEVLLGVQQIDVISFMQMQLYGCFPLIAERGRKSERHQKVDDLAMALSGAREKGEKGESSFSSSIFCRQRQSQSRFHLTDFYFHFTDTF